MTPHTVLASMSREALESAFTQREEQLTQAINQERDMHYTICKLEEQVHEARAQVAKLESQLKALYETIGMREGLSEVDKPEQSTLESIDKRISVLDACQKRWQECGETECAAIYQGAAFELRLTRGKVPAELKIKELEAEVKRLKGGGVE